MIETEYDLSVDRSGTFLADGTAYIDGVGPAQYGERWEIESIQTLVEGSVDESRLRIMQDGRTRVIQGTYSGNFDTSDSHISLQSGQKLYFAYERGTPGATARVTVNGRKFIRGSRAY